MTELLIPFTLESFFVLFTCLNFYNYFIVNKNTFLVDATIDPDTWLVGSLKVVQPT